MTQLIGDDMIKKKESTDERSPLNVLNYTLVDL